MKNVFKTMTGKMKKDLTIAACAAVLGCGILVGGAVTKPAFANETDVQETRPEKGNRQEMMQGGQDFTKENMDVRFEGGKQNGFNKGFEAIRSIYNNLSDEEKAQIQKILGLTDQQIQDMEGSELVEVLSNLDDAKKEELKNLIKDKVESFKGEKPEGVQDGENKGSKKSRGLKGFVKNASEVYNALSADQKKEVESILGLDAAGIQDAEKLSAAVKELSDENKAKLEEIVAPVLQELGLGKGEKPARPEMGEGTEGEKPSRPEMGEGTEGEKPSRPEMGEGTEGEKPARPEMGEGTEGEKPARPENNNNNKPNNGEDTSSSATAKA